MSDLINRSALIKKLQEKSVKDEVNTLSTTYTYKELAYIICNMPTAYDVEKVVAELPTYEFGVSLLNTEKYVKLSDLKKKIDAIRKGGVEWVQ